jgi:hypothetical protein
MARIEINVPNWLDRIFAWPVLVYRKHKFGYTYRRISLGEGKFTIVDPQDYYRYGNLRWHLRGNGRNCYALSSVIVGPMRTTILCLHREIMNAPAGMLVDHRNDDGLDNRRANLRLATNSQNICNSRRNKANCYSQFRGVTFDRCRGVWYARIKINGKSIFLGSFDSEIDAARAYDRAAIKYHGEFARLNFPREDYVNETSPSNRK